MTKRVKSPKSTWGVSPRCVYELCRCFDVEGESARKLKRHAEVVKVGPSAERTREEAVANKDKGGAKNKKAASKTLKEKREAKKAKGKSSDRSGFSSGR
jgi:hypothetical protein